MLLAEPYIAAIQVKDVQARQPLDKVILLIFLECQQAREDRETQARGQAGMLGGISRSKKKLMCHLS